MDYKTTALTEHRPAAPDRRQTGFRYLFIIGLCSVFCILCSCSISYKFNGANTFESAGLTYANYRLVVETVLYNAQGEIPSTRVSNYVIYTNAKVVPNFVG